MGFFKGKSEADATPATGRARRGTQAPGEAAEDLQRRARRRLLGAVAMVLAAVIVLPLILDAEPEAVSSGPVAIHIPGQDTPFEPQLTPSRPEPVIADPVPDERPADLPVTAPVAARPPASLSVSPPQPVPPPRQTPPPATTQPPRTATQPPATPPAQPAARPTTPPATATRPADNNDTERRAEAERALSLLQGRGTPATGSNASGGSGRFAVQVVAVRSRSGADSLLDQLRGAGLPAYIETVSSPAGEVHRVRLGPFTSRSQAESAQARLQNLPGGNRGSLVPL